ncbi:longevity assurance proteins LAG1 LAC1 [Mycena maculata]|uniref:Longevity assurance proteins LAG1 LAC1 n=1 Tax=Mycena maculata TaxID=230809 RepID=A0AAD7J7Q3_9AGAR|nr:longevity assurance proteins LAG1 LAC1 [Mycena maculata]
MSRQRRRTAFTVSTDDSANHFADPFQPQTPLGSATPEHTYSPLGVRQPRISPWLQWVVEPRKSFKLLTIPVVLYLTWELFVPQLEPILAPISPYVRLSNPFGPIFLISHLVPTSDPEDPRYAKGGCDLLFIAYNIVFFSCFRQLVTVTLCRRIAKYFHIHKQAKVDRFGEQGYAVIYFAIFGAWGFVSPVYHNTRTRDLPTEYAQRVMSQQPTYWYRTEYFWIDYPHWDMKPELKRYYLMQLAYWCQQLLVLVLGLEKPRKDFHELVAHHFVTLWLVGWSYFMNLTLIGNAVYLSMDIPDMVFAFSKLLNYIQWERAKLVSFVFFVGVWTYFRHYLNLVILWSVWTEFDLIPDTAGRWAAAEGAYLVWWMRHQIFVAIALLQALNLFWYLLIWRIIVRAVRTTDVQDERSDGEGDDDEEGGRAG